MRGKGSGCDDGLGYSLITIQRYREQDTGSALLSKGAGLQPPPSSASWQLHCTLIPEPFTPHPDSCRQFHGFIVSRNRNRRIQRITDPPTLNRETGSQRRGIEESGCGMRGSLVRLSFSLTRCGDCGCYFGSCAAVSCVFLKKISKEVRKQHPQSPH